MNELTVLRGANLQWTMHLERVWRDVDYHIPGFHEHVRQQVLYELEALADADDSPLGVVITGEAGSGKTHLVGSIRSACAASHAYFVLVDMTDVRDFWETVLLGYLKSLQREQSSGQPQFHRLLASLPGVSVEPEKLANLRPPRLINVTDKLIRDVGRGAHNQRMLEHRDVLRALVLLASSEMQIQAVGFDWLQATGISESQALLQGFSQAQPHPQSVVRGLSWLMSLSGATVLAFDQLDAIVAEHNLAAGVDVSEMAPGLAARVRLSQSIIEGIGRGFMELRDTASRTLMVVSSLQSTWDILKKTSGRAAADRFGSEYNLQAQVSSELQRLLVERRMAATFAKHHFSPPYPSWPFRPTAFEDVHLTPRLLLKRCDEHRRRCLREGKISELEAFQSNGSNAPAAVDDDAMSALDQAYRAMMTEAQPAEILAESREDELGELVGKVARLIPEQYIIPDSLDLFVDDHFKSRQAYEPLHVRVRLVDHRQDDREEHLSLRVLQRAHHLAFQARLRAAITESGIDEGLDFRKLVILRHGEAPHGTVTMQLLDRLNARGGQLAALEEIDSRRLWALNELRRKAPAQWHAWLQIRRPVNDIAALEPLTRWVHGLLEDKRPGTTTQPPPLADKSTIDSERDTDAKPVPPARDQPIAATAMDPTRLPIGSAYAGNQLLNPIFFETAALTKHLAVLAGAGSGKTVLVRRLIEEAALRGIPSLVVDIANDLAMLGDPWPEPPPQWHEEDAALAKQYRERVDVRIFTPGRQSGNPMVLQPLPDLSSVRDDAQELDAAISMAADSLRPIVVTGGGHAKSVQEAILRNALNFLARSGQSDLNSFVELLSDVPPELVEGYRRGSDQAQKMSEALRARMTLDPLLKSEGTPLDPALLFGGSKDGRTRVSVINLAGLGGLESQQNFLNQLTMTLFSWVKKHPLSSQTGLGGLFVIDEAKDFVPANRATICSQSIIRGAAQFRKYGVGMVIATQEPKSIDHRIIANCSSQIYGRANSPAAIETVRDLIRQKGGSGNDISRLQTGQFYVYSEGFRAPIKVQSRLCLTHHPNNPPSADWVAERAARDA